MSEIGYKVVSYNSRFAFVPVILKLEIPDDAKHIMCEGTYICRSNKVKPLGYYVPQIEQNFPEAYTKKYSWRIDEDTYRDYRDNSNYELSSRYCYMQDVKPLIYKLNEIIEDDNDVDLDKNKPYSYGINYFIRYRDAIDWLNKYD